MQLSTFYELIGYLGSVLVAISLMMQSVFRLRVINLIGALIFAVYGFLIRAVPIVLLNSLIVGVNVYFLVQMWNQRDYFKLMEVKYDSRYLKNFIDFYHKEIRNFFPSYLFKPQPDQLVLFVLRNMVPAGLLIVRPLGEDADVFLDFVIPGYRDFRAGKFLFEESTLFFQQRGIKRLCSAPGNPRHESYLRRMGFQLEDGMYYHTVQTNILQEKEL
ncbi:MAG: YgjV family protein [Anaerolineales bacterium]|nr:YgjV family protein [Anaerolineales bacterium]